MSFGNVWVRAGCFAGILMLSFMSTVYASVPVFFDGNPNCADLGFDFETKSDNGYDATVDLLVNGVKVGEAIIEMDTDGTIQGREFTWTSTLPLDAVIVKGGSNANVYFYEPEATADSGLHAPLNDSGDYAAVSHVSLCYDLELDVSKTADTSYKRRYEWTLDKTTPEADVYLRPGDTGSIPYTVTSSSSPVDYDFQVAGTITVSNSWPITANITAVSDQLDDGTVIVPDCGSLPVILASGESLSCSYSAGLVSGNDTINNASVMTSGVIKGASTSAPVTFGVPDTVTDACVSLSDDLYSGDLGSSCVGDGPVSYVLEVGPYECGDHQVVNTASLTSSTGTISDSETVTVHALCLDIEKTATPSFDERYIWQLTKTASPDYLELRPDEDTGDVNYGITMNNHLETENHMVSGTVTVSNNTGMAAMVESITDMLDDVSSVSLDCGQIVFPVELGAGNTINCDYTAELLDTSGHVNHAYVETSGLVGGADTSLAFDFDGVSASNTYDACVSLTDQLNGDEPVDLGSYCDAGPHSATYTQTFGTYACGQYTETNTASIVDADGNELDTDSADVNVLAACLDVSKTAHTSLTRSYAWELDKRSADTVLTMTSGQQYMASYTVDVSLLSEQDSDWMVWGDITVSNSAGNPDAVLTSVSDQLSGIGNLAVECPVSFETTLTGGASLNCSYSASLPDGATRVNTGTADTIGVVAGGSGTATVDFTGAAVTEVDDCVVVSDSNLDSPLGTVCTGESPKTFRYSMTIGPYSECGTYQVPNIAMAMANSTAAESESSWNITVEVVDCSGGCSLTPGYWKTHSEKGPAPYDDTWATLGGADTPFYYSEQSWYEVLWTSPKGGNPYYILAHAYIAAVLNELNGADTGVIQADLDAAEAYFDDPVMTPEYAGNLKGRNRAIREDMIAIAYRLDDYNNGRTGPGHCSEDQLSAQ